MAMTLTPDVFNTFNLIAAVQIILSCMDETKGTELYSSRVIRELEAYDRTKLKRAVWNGGKQVCEQAFFGSNMVSRLTYAVLSVSLNQPEHVQQRFDRELEELMIRYGVNVEEMEGV